MKVKNFASGKEVSLRISRYYIDWNNDGDSSLEIRFRDLIKPYWKNYIVLFQCMIPGSKYEIDFLNCSKRIAVEINGSQHDKFNKFFHNNSKNVWLASMNRDMDKYNWLVKNDIKLIELEEKDLDDFSPSFIREKFGINII